MNELRSLLFELMSALDEVYRSGEVLDEAFELEIARVLELLYNRLEQQTSSAPLMPRGEDLTEAMPSSNVAGFGYDDKTGSLLVQFLGKHPNRHGSIYRYNDVPKQIFELFRRGSVPARTDGKNKWGKWWKGKVPSIGASLYTLLAQNQYPYQRLS